MDVAKGARHQMAAKTLQDELAKLGVKKEEQGKWAKNPTKRKASRYPDNRFGRTVLWGQWIARRNIPGNTDRRCAICGTVVRKSDAEKLLVNDKALEEFIKKEFEKDNLTCNSNILTCKKCVEWEKE